MNAALPEVESVDAVEADATAARAFIEKTGMLDALSAVRVLNEQMREVQPGMEEMIAAVEGHEIAYRRFIRLANGPWFNSRIQVESAYEGFNRFGTAGYYKIAVAACLVSGIGDFANRIKIWPHLEAVARTAENIGHELAPEVADEAFCAAILHDALMPAMSKELRDYMYFIECALETDPMVAGMERQDYQFDHAEAAALLGRELLFPETVLEAVRCHHHESISAISDPRTAKVLSVLMIAERVCSIRRVTANDIFNNPPEQTLLNEIASTLGVPTAKIMRAAAENLKRLRLENVD